MSEYEVELIDDKIFTMSERDRLIAELDAISKQIQMNKENHQKRRQEIMFEYEQKIEETKTEIVDRLEKLFERKKMQSTGDPDPKRNIEDRIRKQLESRYAVRFKEERGKICIELKQKIEAEMKRDAAKKLSQSESELRQQIIVQLEDEIRKDITTKRQKEIQKQCSTLTADYKIQAENYVRNIKNQELKIALAKKVDELKKEASVRISEASAKFKNEVELKLQSHMEVLNTKHKEEIGKEKERLTIVCAKELETESERKKLRIVLNQFKEQIARTIREQLRNQLEPEIKAELVQKCKEEVTRRNKDELARRISEVKNKAKPKIEQMKEEIKRRLKETYDAKLREATTNDENSIRSRIRQEFELDKKEAQFDIDQRYEDKYVNEHDKIEQNMEELKRAHKALLFNIKKLKSEKKSTIEEYESKDFDLTKQEIEIKSQLESAMKEQQSRSMMKKQVTKDIQKENSFLTYRDPLRENILNYSYCNPKGRNELEFDEEISRILPNSDELVDKAINDIGFDDIIAKVMEGEKNETRRDDFLIQNQNDLEDIVDY